MPLIKRMAKIPIWLQFPINILILYALWLVFFKFLRHIWFIDYFYEEVIYYLTFIQLQATKFLLSLLGYKAYVLGKVIWIEGTSGILLDRGCLGRNTLGLFMAFILAYPSQWRQKLWIIVVGTVIFLCLNILRISGLAITQYCCPRYMDINHHLIFKYIVYTAILLMWYWWLRTLRKEKKKAAHT